MNTTEIILTLRLQPEWYKVAWSLSKILGFETFEDYVPDCIETNLRMYLMGEDDIEEKFQDHYKHLVYEARKDLDQQGKDMVQSLQ